MGNTAFTLLILFLLSTCLLLEVVHTNDGLENQIQTNLKFEKVDDGWVVYLSTEDHPSIDVSGKTFLLQFNHALEEKSLVSFALETIMPSDESVHKVYFHHARSQFVLSTPQILFTPSNKFPNDDLSHSRRLIIRLQSNPILTSVGLIDSQSVTVTVINQQLFMSKVWNFYKSIKELQGKDRTFVLDVSSPELFEKTFWNSPMFRPLTFNIDFTPFLEIPPLDSPACSTYNKKLVYDGANPNARLITLISHEYSRVLRTLLSSVSYPSFIEIYGHSIYLGHMIGMAIANGLPVDMSIPDDILTALIMEPENSITTYVVNGFNQGVEAQKSAQLNVLCHGVWTIVPRHFLNKFDKEELNWLITGHPADSINIQFLRKWAKYEHDLSEESTHIVWFWNYVATLNQVHLTTLWEMITGSPRLAVHVNHKIGYEFMIVTSSLQKTHSLSIDSVLPVSIYIGEDEPPLLYIPQYSSELALQTNFKRIIQ